MEMIKKANNSAIKSVIDAIKIVFNPETKCSCNSQPCCEQPENRCTESLQWIFCNKVDNNQNNPKVGALYNFPFGVWFRGQSDKGWSLIPKIFRPIKREKRKYYDETSLFYQFQLANPSFAKEHIQTFDWLCLMQHYGLPTRLLDWTENILVALFFAVCDPLNTDPYCNDHKDGMVFALNARRLNSNAKFSTDKNDICAPSSVDCLVRSEMALSRNSRDLYFNLKKNGIFQIVAELFKCKDNKDGFKTKLRKIKINTPVAVFPRRSNIRMTPQLSVFTISGGKIASKPSTDMISKSSSVSFKTKINDSLPSPDPMDITEFNKKAREKIVMSFIVPSHKKGQIRTELSRIGIHAGVLFPEIEHQAKHLAEFWQVYEYKNNK